MAIVPIPNLAPALTLDGTEQIPAVQDGITVRITTAQLKTLVNGGVTIPLPIALGGTGAADVATAQSNLQIIALVTTFVTTGPSTVDPIFRTLTLQGGQIVPLTSIAVAYNILSTDFIVESTGASGVPTLPTAIGIVGQLYIIKNSSGGSITPATTASQTIDGSAPGAISNHGVLRVYSDNANWQSW